MNETNFEHAIYAVLLQIAVGVLTGNWWIGAAAGVFFFLGRELNPIMAKAMSWIGVVPALAVVKVVALAAFYVGLGVQAPDWVYTPHVTAGLCGFYGLVVCNNWRLVAAQA